MIAGIGSTPNADMAARWQDLLKRADKDGDGRISKAEFKAGAPQGVNADELFAKLDTNGDGYIDEAENAAAAQKMPKGHHHRRQNATDPLQIFEKADKDGDGNISRAEFLSALPPGSDSGAASKLFDSMDTNQDGTVSAAEYVTALEKMGQFNQLFAPQSFSTLA